MFLPSLSRRVYRRIDERFGPAREFRASHDEMLCTPLLPGFELPLATLFRR